MVNDCPIRRPPEPPASVSLTDLSAPDVPEQKILDCSFPIAIID
jgi:hypothetical protein